MGTLVRWSTYTSVLKSVRWTVFTYLVVIMMVAFHHRTSVPSVLLFISKPLPIPFNTPNEPDNARPHLEAVGPGYLMHPWYQSRCCD